MPRFVLLLHSFPEDHPRSTHCDLMLEDGGRLRTWSLAQLPRDWSGLDFDRTLAAATNCVEAAPLVDHRVEYLDYQGPVSGDRGSVRRLESGEYRALTLPSRFELRGQVIRGEIEILFSPGDDAKCRLTYWPDSSPNEVEVSPAT